MMSGTSSCCADRSLRADRSVQDRSEEDTICYHTRRCDTVSYEEGGCDMLSSYHVTS